MSLPTGSPVRAVVAWHPELGAAGKHARQEGLTEGAFRLVLLPTAPQTIRIVSIDGQGVSGLRFGVNVSTPGGSWFGTDVIPAAQLMTDADGEARADWLPKELEYVEVINTGYDWKFEDIEREKTSQGLTTVRVRRKLPVQGRLIMPPGAAQKGSW